jgi:hypothetical protein
MYSDLIEGLRINNIVKSSEELFSINKFREDLKENSNRNNKSYHAHSENINSYDIAHNCIRSSMFRLLSYELENYSDVWLPIKLRSTLGTSCHEFIQETSSVFTEKEVSLRIPSISMSVRIDCLIGTNTLVEIKSCNYTDFEKICKNNSARSGDFNQALLYKYLIETYIDEIKSFKSPKRYNLPRYDKYDIENVQFIYLCHELFSADHSLEQSVSMARELRKQLNSKFNQMWFIKDINYKIKTFDITERIQFIKTKIDEINKYLKSKTIPDMDHEMVDKSKCFFCLHKKICNS